MKRMMLLFALTLQGCDAATPQEVKQVDDRFKADDGIVFRRLKNDCQVLVFEAEGEAPQCAIVCTAYTGGHEGYVASTLSVPCSWMDKKVTAR